MYESFYKLRVSPFQLSPNPLFYYDSDTHRRGLIKLRQAIRNGNMLTVVSGEPGTGKSELLKKFMQEFDVKSTVIANLPLTSLRSSNILDYIASAFGVVNMGFVGDALWSKNALIGKIQQHVSMQLTEGKNFIVIIDNAESLSKSCFKKLLQLCSVRTNGVPLIQCYLFGESSVIKQLRLEQELQDNSQSQLIGLNALAELETRRYIEHRLMEAGWQGDPEITNGAYELIHNISEGVPWHINLLCHRILLQSYLEDTHRIDERIVSMFSDGLVIEEQWAAGSDVARNSNVVNLNSNSTGRDAKGTSFNSESQSYSVARPQNSEREALDSISHFFSEPQINQVKANSSSDFDDMPFSVEEVQEAFSSCGIQEGKPKIDATCAVEESGSELFFPEVNDRVGMDSFQGTVNSVAMEETIANAAKDENKITASILQRVFPKTVAMMENYSGSSFSRSYPILEMPASSEEVAQNFNDYEDQAGSRSSFQIATRASIVTSLVITLVMWVISDTRTVDVQSIQMTKSNTQEFNSVTPSPFQNPSDISRSRVILVK